MLMSVSFGVVVKGGPRWYDNRSEREHDSCRRLFNPYELWAAEMKRRRALVVAERATSFHATQRK